MAYDLMSIVKVALDEIADKEHGGYYAPVGTPLLDFYLLSLHANELMACGYDPIAFNYISLEEELVKLVGFGNDAPFDLNWVQSEEDPDGGNYELQITNMV